MSQVLYRKWRPQSLSEVVGQEHVTKTLLNALTTGRLSHAYLFAGPRGTGKTSTGRILAKAVSCLTTQGKGEPCNTCALCQAVSAGQALDVIEIDAASNRGIDEMRELRERAGYAPNQARYKVYIIDEVHMLTTPASNALLKTLEEPPPHVIFILATTEAHKILPTILSRCQRFDFRRISQADIIAKLSQVCQAEGIEAEPDSLRLIARATTGSLRDAENLLQQMATFYGNKIEMKQVQAVLGITGDLRARDLVKQLIKNDISSGITIINNVNRDGADLRQFSREIVEYLRCLMLTKVGAIEAVDVTNEDRKELQALAGLAPLTQITRSVRLFSQLELSLDNYSTLPLELALIDAVSLPEKKEARAQVEPKAAAPAARTPVQPAKEPPRERLAPAQPKPVTPEAVALAKPVETAPAAPTSEIERLRQNWRQFINDMPEINRTPAAALLRTARPKAIEDDKVILSFKYPLHKENMEKPDNQRVAEKFLGHFLGHPCKVSCVHEPEDNHLVEAALKVGAQIIEGEEE